MPLPKEWVQFSPDPRPLAGGDTWHVFLSYRSVNRAWVLNLYDVLTERGYKVFLDQLVLKPGDELNDQLETALRASQSGVLIWSAKAKDSNWVKNKEYPALERLADKKPGFVFVPLRLDDCELPLFAEGRVYVDFSSYPDGPNGGELLRLLYALAGKQLDRAALDFATAQDQIAKDQGAKVAAALRNKDGDRILTLFQEGGIAWRTSSALGCKAAQGLINLGRNDDALAVLAQHEQAFPNSIRPKQLLALALAKRGRPDDLATAQEILGLLYEKQERDPETLGIYARTWMDRYKVSHDRSDLEQSRDLYAEAFAHAPDDYYTGINAAAKSVFLGGDENLARAATLAAAVQTIVGTEPVQNPKASLEDNYWATATVGEVFLIQRKYTDAARLYAAAVKAARALDGAHASTWTQASALMAELNPSDAERAAIRTAFDK
jgi:hypothetical protein